MDHDNEPDHPVPAPGPPTSAVHNPPSTGPTPPPQPPAPLSVNTSTQEQPQSPGIPPVPRSTPLPPVPSSSTFPGAGQPTRQAPNPGPPAGRPVSIRVNPIAQRSSSSAERLRSDDADAALRPRGIGAGQPLPPLPPLPHDIRVRNGRFGVESPLLSPRPRSGIDYIVPIDDKAAREKTVGERLQPTLVTAKIERDKYAFKAKMTGYTLNAAIGLQVLLGALTTGLAAAVTTGHQAAISTTILGGLSTLVASYMARARGSNEPELSITRVKDLEQFIRECEAFTMDFGHTVGGMYDQQLENLRRRFEELLGNANGERRLSPPV